MFGYCDHEGSSEESIEEAARAMQWSIGDFYGHASSLPIHILRPRLYMAGDFLKVMLKAKVIRDRQYPPLPLGGQPGRPARGQYRSQLESLDETHRPIRIFVPRSQAHRSAEPCEGRGTGDGRNEDQRTQNAIGL